MRLVCDTAFLTNTELTTDADKFAKEMLPRVQLTEKVITENIKQSQSENKRYYDRGTAEVSFEIGEKCWLRNMQRKVGVCPKMERPWIGPYLVVQKGSKGNYKLRHAITDIPLAIPVHVNRMKKYVEPYHQFRAQAQVTRQDQQRNPDQAKKNTKERTPEQDKTNKQDNTTITDVSNNEDRDDATQNKKNEWHDIKTLLKRRGARNKIEFLVKWMDDSESWVKANWISPQARSEYYARIAAQGRKIRRRRAN